jgi:transglutaminase-like putative cysteine protease
VKPDVKGRYTVDVTDVPPAPDEEWTPPINSYLYRVVFYYKSSGSAAAFWKDDGKLWSKDVDRFANTSKPIHDAVDGLIATGDSDLDKAKKLYKAVQDLDNTDYSRHKSESELKQLKLKVAKRAEDTWAQKSGSSEDIAQLYLAMLRAAGLTAYAVKVVNRGEGMFDQTYLTFNQLDDTLVYLSTGGKEILLDPGEKMCPFQTVNWRHSGAGGVRQTAGDPEITFTALQEYPANKITRVGDVTLDPQGIMTGNFSFSMIGQEALRWRQDALEYDLDEVKKQFDHSLESIVPEGTEAHVDHFLGLDNPDLNLIAVIKVHGTLGAATSRRLLVPAFFFQSRGTAPFVAQDKREEPIDMHFGEEVFDQVTYHLPEGFTVEGAPQDAKITWPQQALLVDKTVPRAGQLIVARTFARAFTFAKPDEYQDLRGFYQKVAAADQQELVLTAAPAAKGN